MSATIQHVHAREVFDSRGRPTVEVEVTCRGGAAGRAIVPSGASTGRFEAVELRDRDEARLGGAGVRMAVQNVCTHLAPRLVGCDAADQQTIDRLLCSCDGTPHKSRLGANAILGCSLATAHAAAAARHVPLVEHLARLWEQVPSQRSDSAVPALAGPSLPLPMVNMISGGLHAGGNLDFQDYLILPVGAATYSEALDWTVAVYGEVGRELTRRGFEGRLVGDEGGYGPRLPDNRVALDVIVAAIEAAGLRPGNDVALGLDVAATHFFDGQSYRLSATGDRALSSADMVDTLESWTSAYPIVSIEDGLAEDDWTGWEELTRRLGSRVQLIGDDLFVTNTARLRRGIDSRCANAVLIKVNQVGTLWETLETLRLALDSGYRTVVSARSGETEDVTIADLAVATGAGQIKIGSVARSERLAKYNQLLRLEERLGAATYWQPPLPRVPSLRVV